MGRARSFEYLTVASCGWGIRRIRTTGPYTGHCYVCKSDLWKMKDKWDAWDKMELHMKEEHGASGEDK